MTPQQQLLNNQNHNFFNSVKSSLRKLNQVHACIKDTYLTTGKLSEKDVDDLNTVIHAGKQLEELLANFDPTVRNYAPAVEVYFVSKKRVSLRINKSDVRRLVLSITLNVMVRLAIYVAKRKQLSKPIA